MMIKKRFTFIKDTVAPNLKTPIVFNNETISIGEVLDKLNELSDENESLKKESYELHKRLGDFKPFEDHIKERTSKTSVNDIIGLVKTDEPTDIVELEKELKE